MTIANIWKALHVFFFLSEVQIACSWIFMIILDAKVTVEVLLIRIKQCWMVCCIDQDMFIVFMKILNIYVGGNKFKKTKTEGKKKRENENSMMKAKNLNKLYMSVFCQKFTMLVAGYLWLFSMPVTMSYYGSPCNNSIYFWTKQCRMFIW